MPKFINGPINYAYLEGNINGIEKKIYLFMDIHKSLNEETRCKSFDIVDISYYLYKKIKDAKKRLDIFMEINPTDLKIPITNKKDIYINKVTNLFKSEFVVKKVNEIENVRCSKTNKNVRLHYLDIRDHLELFDVLDIIKNIRRKIKLLEEFDINKDKVEYKKEELKKKILTNLEEINGKIKILTNNKNNLIINTNIEYDKTTDKQKYYLNKVLNKYQDENLRNNIILFLDDYYANILFNLKNIIKNIKNCLVNFNTNEISQINNYLDFIKEAIIDLYSIFTDVFLLRRILDKNYINNCVIYSCCQHSFNYIFFLVKYYNFNIIKIYNSEKKSDELELEIKKALYPFNIYKLFYIKEKEYIQCVNYIPMYFGGSKYSKYSKY
jgi:hypothetical protein